MRESDRTIDVHAVSTAYSPHGAGKIAETVCGKKCRMLEGRNEVTAGQVCLMMFYPMKSRFELGRITVERLPKRIRNARELRQNFCAFPCERRHPNRVKQFCGQAWVGISRNGHVVNIRQIDSCGPQAITNCGSGESRRIFDAIKSFFFDRSDQLAIRDERGGSVAMIGVDPKNIHFASLAYLKVTIQVKFPGCGYPLKCCRHHSFST